MTDRRLLWQLDDAPVARVRSLPIRDVADVSLRVQRPHTAATIERHLRRDAEPSA